MDDFLHGSNSIEEPDAVQQDLTALLSKGKRNLRKWRTNSQALRDAITADLLESDSLQVGDSITGCPKALGIHWQTSSDQLLSSLHLHSQLNTPPRDKFTHSIQEFLTFWDGFL